MLLGVVSDTHNNSKNIESIISLFNKRNVSMVAHTGDISNAQSLKRFSKLKCDLVGVYGNNDRFELGLAEIAESNGFYFNEPPLKLKKNGKNIVIFHEPDLIEEFLSKNKEIDIVLHGHTHRFRKEQIGQTLIFNPGESAGFLAGKNSIGIINLKNLSVERIFF